MAITAILIDGSFYLHRARRIWGDKSPSDRAKELHDYALKHITEKRTPAEEDGRRSLYRIFYYDCPPANGISIRQPWNGRNATLGTKRNTGKWRKEFLDALAPMRKVAMRMGSISYAHARFIPTEDAVKSMAAGEREFRDLTENDFILTGIKQEGVDMRIGIDVSSLAHNRIVNQIILIAGDCDFIPVAKAARRAGVDFILDPMGHHVKNEMMEQVDGIEDLTSTMPTVAPTPVADDQGFQTN